MNAATPAFWSRPKVWLPTGAFPRGFCLPNTYFHLANGSVARGSINPSGAHTAKRRAVVATGRPSTTLLTSNWVREATTTVGFPIATAAITSRRKRDPTCGRGGLSLALFQNHLDRLKFHPMAVFANSNIPRRNGAGRLAIRTRCAKTEISSSPA